MSGHAPRWDPAAAEATAWPLAPLLALRISAEERAAADALRAGAAWRRACDEASRRAAAFARAGAASRVASPADLGIAARFLRRCAADARAAAAEAEHALGTLRAAEVAHAVARSRREAVEQAREAWRADRARSRAAAAERELEDLALYRGAVSSEPPPRRGRRSSAGCGR